MQLGLISGEELRMSENRAWKRIYLRKREEIIRSRRKGINEKLHNLCSTTDRLLLA
jgi:hypothetical protein